MVQGEATDFKFVYARRHPANLLVVIRYNQRLPYKRTPRQQIPPYPSLISIRTIESHPQEVTNYPKLLK